MKKILSFLIISLFSSAVLSASQKSPESVQKNMGKEDTIIIKDGMRMDFSKDDTKNEITQIYYGKQHTVLVISSANEHGFPGERKACFIIKDNKEVPITTQSPISFAQTGK